MNPRDAEKNLGKRITQLRKECERFSRRMMAEGHSAIDLAGLMIGAHSRAMREVGITREMYLEACAVLWDNNNPADTPVDEDPTKT